MMENKANSHVLSSYFFESLLLQYTLAKYGRLRFSICIRRRHICRTGTGILAPNCEITKIFVFCKIRELVDYLARGLPEGERTSESQPFLPFQDVLAPGKGQKSIEDHEDARRKALIMVLTQVKGLGDGTEKGVLCSVFQVFVVNLDCLRAEVEGFFNLLFSHFLTLLPLDAPETKEQLVTLLQTIATSPEQTTFTKYRMYEDLILSMMMFLVASLVLDYQTCSTPFLASPICAIPYTKPFSRLQVRTMN